MEEEIRETLKDNLIEAISKRKSAVLKEIFETVPSIDIAEVLEEIGEIPSILYVLRVIDNELSSEIFAEFSSELQEKIINAFSDKELVDLISNSFADDIVDTLEELPANVVNRILKVCPKDIRKDVNVLLNYKENTAGSVMTTEYLEVKDTLTVKEAIETIRAKGKDAETVYTVFVRDSTRTIVGTLDLDDLIFAKETELVTEIMNKDFVTCKVNDDQEEVANMFKRYDLNAMAVVNHDDKIVGIITIDDVVDIIVQEASEDIAHMNAVSDMEDPYLKTPVLKIVLKCFPWILVLMVLQVFSTMVLSSFQSAMSSLAILAVFTPLIMDAGGNSGGQTTTMIVRSLSLNEFSGKDYGKVIWKELRVAALIGVIVSAFSFAWLMFEMSVGIVDTTSLLTQFPNIDANIKMSIIAGLVAITLFITMIISRLVGCSLPFLAKLIKLDPAVMCGPITTTIVDIISLITYFLVWTQILLPILQ